jgi:hypothetical protein
MIESTDRNYNGGLELVVMKYFYDIRGNKLRCNTLETTEQRRSIIGMLLKTSHLKNG